MPTNYTLASRPTATPMTVRQEVTTSYTSRTLFVSNTVEPIITGFWNDLLTWNETDKFWNDNGNTSAIYTTRPLI